MPGGTWQMSTVHTGCHAEAWRVNDSAWGAQALRVLSEASPRHLQGYAGMLSERPPKHGNGFFPCLCYLMNWTEHRFQLCETKECANLGSWYEQIQ